MRPFLSVLVLAGWLLPGSIGATFCTVDDDTPVFSSPDLGSRVVTLVERNTCFHGDMDGEWLVLQDTPIYYIHGYTVNEDTKSSADINGFREYDPWYKPSVRSRCVDVEGINTCAGARSIHNNRQEKRFVMGDATWTNWIEWSECNSLCNVEGTRNRTRQCFALNPNVQANCNGGDSIQLQKCTKSCLGPCSDGYSWTVWHDCTKTCDGITTRLGVCWNGTANVTTTEENNCTRELCPVDGTWSDWGKWGSCSTTMNLAQGIRFRYKQCLPTNRHGGADCPGKPYDTGVCLGSDWDEWSSWTNCTSTNCSKGLTVRMRYCKIQNCTGAQYEEKACYLKDCPINGAWGAWEGWSVCDCKGVRGRFRHCDSPPPSNGGQDCQDVHYEVNVCNKTSNCSVDGSWGAWEGWSVCYCNGFRPRYRKCDSPPPLTGGQYCNGSEFEVGMCNRTSNTNCPVDGKWTDWSAWSTCSVSCENGTQSRNRNCTNPPQAYGGKDCGSDDRAFQNCSISISCPVSGGWSTWSDWSSCSATCQAPGLQYRNRSCDNPPPDIDGQNCTGDVGETHNCNGLGACPVAGGWSTWSNWSICSATCQATGMQYRNRSCDSPTPENGGQNCTGDVEGIRNCNGTGPCPVDGGYSNWLQWYDCSATCDGGVKYRSRECNNPRPQNGGSNCSVLGKSTDEPIVCNIQPCPVDGNWGLWSNWSGCDVTCGNGTRTRDRLCEGIKYDGKNCSGNALQIGACHVVICPVDGAWGQWADWSVCNCNSTQTRVRKCDSPAPVESGLQCPGSTRDTVSCSDKPATCPVDGQWGSWYPWSDCSTTCGPGEMSRLRSCTNPRPQNGGLYCDIDQKGEEDHMKCRGSPCPIDGSWSDWTPWSACSVTCGNGSHSRNRSCDHPAPAYGGVNCAGSDNENGSCTQKHCPIDGNWSGWSAWSACDVTCATGTKHRARTCDSPAPKYGGQPCNKTAAQFEQCQEPPCPIDGIWGSWQSWAMCSVTCLNGTRSRTRLCDSPTPQHGGSDCKEQQNGTETCTMRDNCDVDGGWTEWGLWSVCDVSCSTGHHTRYRLCENPTPENFGKYCEGPESEMGECFDKPCPIDGRFGAWMAWGSCFPSTGNGLKTRTRLCDNPQPMNGGRNCQGNYTEQLQCCESDCPVDGGWSDWSAWSNCPADSFVNTNKSRTRTCSMPFPKFGGASCTGDSEETDCCPVNGGFGAWTDWSVCSGSCIDAHRERVRQCNNPRPSCGGRYCGSGKEVDHTCIPDNCTTTTTTTTASPSAWSPAIIASNITEAITPTTTIASTSGLIPAVTSAASVTTTTATQLSTSTTQVTAGNSPTDVLSPTSSPVNSATTSTAGSNNDDGGTSKTTTGSLPINSTAISPTETSTATTTLPPTTTTTGPSGISETTTGSLPINSTVSSPTEALTATSTLTPTTTTTGPSGISETTTGTAVRPTAAAHPIQCTLCKVNPQLCFVLTKVEMCPDSYCINEVTNKEDGSKWVDRRCGTYDECENDWWHSTSDDPDCQDYKPDQNTMKDIHCTYCCTTDNCNRDIKPAQDTLYTHPKK